jgi:hypothetical protein
MKKKGHGRGPNRLSQERMLASSSEKDSSCTEDEREKNEVSIQHSRI